MSETRQFDDGWGSRETYEPGDKVTKIRGCLRGTVLREVEPGRFGKRYSVRDDIAGVVGTYRVDDLRPLRPWQ